MEHYCQEHKTVFFKKGHMKGYAHPIGDTGKWCNEENQESGKLYNGPTKSETLPEPSTPEPKIDNPRKSNGMNRSVAVSYAKDLACAGKITLDQIATYADKFLEYMEK